MRGRYSLNACRVKPDRCRGALEMPLGHSLEPESFHRLRETFEVKRSNFELSMKVRMENKSALLGLTHQAVLNGCKTNFKDIMDRSQKVTYEECNRVIKKHLQGKEFVHVLCGDFKKTGVEVL